jgi:hypothetical protein
MDAAHAPAVACPNILNGRVQVGLFGENGKSLFELVAVPVRLRHAKMFIAILGDTCQVFFG